MRRLPFWAIPLLILLFSAAGSQAAGELVLEPRAIGTGGVALLSWKGEKPAYALARFNGSLLYLEADGKGQMKALLGADVAADPGIYPVRAVVIDSRGGVRFQRVNLEIRALERPEERLTLPEGQVSPRRPEVLERIGREHLQLRELYARTGTPPLWRGFQLPVDDPVSSPFGLRRILNGQPRSPHAGIDFRSPRGTPVRASARGRVVLAADLFFTGNTVLLDHGGGLFSIYAHLERIDCQVQELLDAGAVLGRVGSTGRSTGPHLHWGVKLRGERIDPSLVVELLAGEKP